MLRSALPPGRAAHAVCSCAAALPKPRRGALSLCRFVALSTPRGITLRFAFGSARSQPSFRIESRASHRLPPAMFHLLHFLTASEAGGFAALVRARARPDAQRFLFPAARAAKRDSAARTQPSARRRRPRAWAPQQKVVANRPEALPRRPAPIARTCRPRGGRTDGGTFAPARLRHMQGAKRRTPFAIRNIVRERTHRPARALRPILGFRRASASRPSSLAPHAGEPSADNDGPRAQTDSPRGHARLFSPTQSATRERAPAARSPRHRTRSAAPSLNAR